MRAIATLSEWLKTDYSDRLGEEGKKQLDLLSNRVKRMHNLIDGILQYSRVGRETEEKSELNLNEFVRSIQDTLSLPAFIKIRIENELPSLYFERTKMTQIFQNLMSNAIKYMDKPEGVIRIGCQEEDGYYKFRVSDNGPGIEEKHFGRIFQIFQTLQPKDQFESTGIGLTIVKKIIEKNGGKIWVESNRGEGTTFWFTIPLSPQKIFGGLSQN